MRIYKSDGSYTDHPQDTLFGWNLQDIVVDEAIADFRVRNLQLRESARPQITTEDEEQDLEDFEVIEHREVAAEVQIKVEEITPEVRVTEGVSVIEPSFVENAVLDTIYEEGQWKLENIDSKIPSKQQITALINPCSVESKTLLSVVHFAKHKHLAKDVVNLGDIRNTSKIKFLIGQKSEDIEDNLRKEIETYHAEKEQNMMSLMVELILKDTNSEISDITETSSNNNNQNLESSDLGKSIVSDTETSSQNFSCRLEIDDPARSELLSSIGLSDIFDRSLQRICEETYDVHLSIADLKKSFSEEETRVNSLITESQKIEKHLRETKFLDDLIHLLNGDLEKISLKRSPFRIFTSPSSSHDEQNLII